MQGRTVVIQQRVSSQCITKRKTCNYSRGFKCILCTENMDLIIALVEMIQIFKIRFKGINILWNLVKIFGWPMTSLIFKDLKCWICRAFPGTRICKFSRPFEGVFQHFIQFLHQRNCSTDLDFSQTYPK